jgi:hypothetical protein
MQITKKASSQGARLPCIHISPPVGNVIEKFLKGGRYSHPEHRLALAAFSIKQFSISYIRKVNVPIRMAWSYIFLQLERLQGDHRVTDSSRLIVTKFHPVEKILSPPRQVAAEV